MITAIIIITAFVVGFICLGAGKKMGDDAARERQADAAAAICPTCASFIEPAGRMLDAGARIQGVNHYGKVYPFDGGGPDPINDANQILRIATGHVERLRKHGVEA